MFKVKDRLITSVEPFHYKPVTDGEVYTLGEALKGEAAVTKCGAAEKPVYICMGPAAGGIVPVLSVLATTRFAVEYTEKPTVGDVVTLDTDALQVTATTGGAFTVTGIDEEKGIAFGYFK